MQRMILKQTGLHRDYVVAEAALEEAKPHLYARRTARSCLVQIVQKLRLEPLALNLRRVVRKNHTYVEFRFQARRCRSFMQKLGLIRGVTAYVKCQHKEPAGTLRNVRIPGAKSPLILRSGADLKVFEQVFVGGQYDLETANEPRLIVDAGAHVGCATVFFATKFPKCTILAIEPESSNFALLCRNVAHYSNVIPIRAAVWHKPAVLSTANPDSESWSFRMKQASSKEYCLALGLTLDEILAWCGISDIDILKLDIEGSEKEIFATARSSEWINRVKEIVVELHDRVVPGCTEALEDAIRDHAFSLSTSGECMVMRRL